MKSIIVSVLLAVCCPATALAQSLDGVWIIDEIIVGGGEDAGRHTDDVQPNLFFFSGAYYSRMFLRGWEPRELMGENPTDEVRLAAYTPFVANAGTYELQGSTITFTPSVAKSPDRMAPDLLIQEIEWDGDSYWLTFDSAEGDWKDRAHFVRPEQ